MGFFRKIGGALAPGGKSLENVTAGIGDAIGSLGQNLVESQRIRHESERLREQQAFLSRYQADAARHQEAAAEADARRAWDAADHQAAIDAKAAAEDQERQVALATHRARLEVLTRVELLELEVNQANTPFAYDYQRVRADALDVTRAGDRPLLLLAPFFDDSSDTTANDARPTGFLLALHHAWDQQPWQADMGRLTGVFRRPLRMLDVDLLTIRQVLDDLPTVMVFGEVELGQRLWVNVVGWNLATDREPAADSHVAAGAPVAFRLVLPPLEMPDTSTGSRTALAFRDEVAAEALLLAELYAEWFHVARGRDPSLHRVLPEPALPLTDVIAVGSAAMLDIAVEGGRLDPLVAALAQARVYRDVGQTGRALEILRRVVGPNNSAHLNGQSFLQRSRDLAGMLHELGDDDSAAAVAAAARRVARHEILRRTAWGD